MTRQFTFSVVLFSIATFAAASAHGQVTSATAGGGSGISLLGGNNNNNNRGSSTGSVLFIESDKAEQFLRAGFEVTGVSGTSGNGLPERLTIRRVKRSGDYARDLVGLEYAQEEQITNPAEIRRLFRSSESRLRTVRQSIDAATKKLEGRLERYLNSNNPNHKMTYARQFKEVKAKLVELVRKESMEEWFQKQLRL